MNSKQLTILIIAFVLFLMSLLTPPWLYKDTKTHEQRAGGYHLFTNEAQVKSDAEIREIFLIDKYDLPRQFTVQKHRSRLYCQLMAILFLSIGGFLFTIEGRKPLIILISVCIMSIGLIFVSVVLVLSWTIRYA